MANEIFIYDPTLRDNLSAVRGIGRYLSTLRQMFEHKATFTSDLKTIPSDGIFLNPFYDFLKPPLSLKRLAKRQIAVIHDLIPLKYSRKFPAGIKGNINIIINSYLLRHYDTIITDSEVSRKDIHTFLHIDPKRIHIAYPPLSGSFYELANGAKHEEDLAGLRLPKEGYCIYVGDATWNKNLVNLARAIKIANVHCVFVGKVFEKRRGGDLNHLWLSELKEFIRITLGDKRFIFPGYLTDEQLIALYKHAHMNILVSRDEGFGYSFIEAGACATPSVLSDEPIFHETAQDAALFATTERPTDIAAKISQLYNSRVEAHTLGILAKQRSGYFSAESFEQSVSAVLYNDYNP